LSWVEFSGRGVGRNRQAEAPMLVGVLRNPVIECLLQIDLGNRNAIFHFIRMSLKVIIGLACFHFSFEHGLRIAFAKLPLLLKFLIFLTVNIAMPRLHLLVHLFSIRVFLHRFLHAFVYDFFLLLRHVSLHYLLPESESVIVEVDESLRGRVKCCTVFPPFLVLYTIVQNDIRTHISEIALKS
jgi:hypothetical protein